MGVRRVPVRLMALALFTRMSIPPNVSAAFAAPAAICSSKRMSICRGSAFPPASSTSRAAEWMVPGSVGWATAVFAARTTFAPSAAARSAIAFPIPRLPPVMNIVFPLSVAIASPPVRRRYGYGIPRRGRGQRKRCEVCGIVWVAAGGSAAGRCGGEGEDACHGGNPCPAGRRGRLHGAPVRLRGEGRDRGLGEGTGGRRALRGEDPRHGGRPEAIARRPDARRPAGVHEGAGPGDRREGRGPLRSRHGEPPLGVRGGGDLAVRDAPCHARVHGTVDPGTP